MKRPSLKTYRRISQVLILLLFIAVPILNKSRYSLMYGNLLSFHLWFIPLADPLAVFQLSLKNFYMTLDNFIGAFLPLLLAFFLGTVFCSWICPYGYLSEMVFHLRRRINRPESIRGNSSMVAVWCKISIFFIGIILFLIFSTTPVLNQLSLPAWYTRFFQYYFGQGYFSLSIFAIAAILFVEFLFKKRLWCRYICPQSVLIILVKRINSSRLMVKYDPNKCLCKNETRERCTNVCTLGLRPKNVGRVNEYECTNCGDCTGACNQVGKALQLKRNKK